MSTKIDDSLISNHFQPPISYNPFKMELAPNIVEDLELTSTIAATVRSNDLSDNLVSNANANANANDKVELSMYNIILSPTNCFGKETLPLFSKHYTTDVAFLKDTQTVLKTFHPTDVETFDFNPMKKCWEEIKGETSFCEKYLYVDWEMGKFLNTNSSFLQFMSYYNVTSPIFSLCLPILILIIPFFIIKLKGLNLNVAEYTEILKTIISKHAVGKLFTNLSEVSFNEQIYLFISAALYLFSIYQNVLVCLRFYKNIYNINHYLSTIKQYLGHTMKSMDYYLSITEKLDSYTPFNDAVKTHQKVLRECSDNLSTIQEFKLNWTSILNIGNILKMFYLIYDNSVYNASFVFSFGFHGYIDNISGLIQNITNNKMNYAEFNTTKNSKTVFRKTFYPSLMNEKHVVNDCDFGENMLITGPNASGKTTMLKSSLINIIFTQQFGCGCYSSANISTYKYIHCYLNIPDTSGRDSLFQAEARRCKSIIDCISENKDDTHFCAFDELYSGTNPEDAVSSSIAFMNYMLTHENVTSILTTHYVKVCKKLAKHPRIKNYRMKVKEGGDGTFEYTYILESGISKIKGGLKVLSDMDYPTEILNKI
jgi:hypothetical protein